MISKTNSSTVGLNTTSNDTPSTNSNTTLHPQQQDQPQSNDIHRNKNNSNDNNSSNEAVEALFSQYPVAELRKIESKLVADIEKKKQELRFVVGEKYRDLIDAADSIQFMETSIQKIDSKLSSLLQRTQSEFEFEQKDEKLEKESKTIIYSIAAQIKLLSGTPEQIWLCLEENKYLNAVVEFLMAKVVNKHLNSQDRAQIRMFPVIQRHWDAIHHLKAQIVLHAIQFLKGTTTNEQDVSKTLVAIMLLNLSSPLQVLELLVEERTKSIKNMSFAISETGDQKILTIIQTVKCILMAILRTVHHLLFCIANGDNDTLFALIDLIQSSDNETVQESKYKLNEAVSSDSREHGILKYLPAAIDKYIPYVNRGDLGQEQVFEFMSGKLQEWFKDMESWITENMIPQLQSSVGISLNDVLILRKQMIVLIEADIEESFEWKESGSALFDPPRSLWRDCFDKMLSEVLKNEMSISFKNAISVYLTNLNKEMDAYDTKHLDFFGQATYQTKVPQKLTLELYSCLQNLCGSIQKDLMNSEMENYQDSVDFERHFDIVTSTWVSQLVEGVSKASEVFQEKSHILSSFVQALLREISNYTSIFQIKLHLKKVQRPECKIISMFKSKRDQLNLPSSTYTTPAYKMFKKEIEKIHDQINTLWMTKILNSIDLKMDASGLFDSNGNGWQSFSIPNEGDQAPDTMFLPTAPSFMLVSTMTKLTQSVHECIGFAVDEKIKDKMQETFSDFFYAYYEKAVASVVEFNSQIAMQLYFDVLSLNRWFENMKPDIGAKHDQLLAFALDKIDPIDFAIGKSQLLDNIDLYQMSSHVLFGVFLRETSKGKWLTSDSSSVINLAQQPCRFTLLPLAPEDTMFTVPAMASHHSITPQTSYQGNLNNPNKNKEGLLSLQLSNSTKPHQQQFSPCIQIKLNAAQYSSMYSTSTTSPTKSNSSRIDATSSATSAFSSFAASLLNNTTGNNNSGSSSNVNNSNNANANSPSLGGVSSGMKGNKNELFSVASSLLSNVFHGSNSALNEDFSNNTSTTSSASRKSPTRRDHK